ncbi:hypothetical protein BpOF4_04800 [Alkalihalophilus pseudofirmus OF4]|uniref:YetF C-terminal domain-containing protein n=1 Tax=Alkalihalophilus pseudofirmus (strain ATCC BAA-2126 / JCM 17055 / OF4) TaxID=398511 RepID=D3FYZ1_ALKPO|nr:DUF421 domain-containing protein [Alkalihalophilus pseudofirmus]ADC49024.1 hypothetical protein BpOF4_04800 [Alkalihalophilus pseudofirmus OF4]
MELTKELFILIIRIITIIPLLLFITLKMGRRSIAELPVFDFLIIITLGAVVGADLADPDIDHLHTAAAVVFIGIFQIIVATLKISNRTFGKMLTFEPAVVIYNGIFLIENLKQIRYSIDNVLMMLRENDVFDVSEVELAIIEANGTLTVHKKPDKKPLTRADANVAAPHSELALPVIIDGYLYKDVITHLEVSEEWVYQQLEELGVPRIEDVFFASLNKDHTFHVSLRQNQLSLLKEAPLLYH